MVHFHEFATGIVPQCMLEGLFHKKTPKRFKYAKLISYDQIVRIFHGICHRKFDLRYIGGVLEPRKLDFSGLKGQFEIKKVNLGDFRGLLAKISYLRPILVSRNHT